MKKILTTVICLLTVCITQAQSIEETTQQITKQEHRLLKKQFHEEKIENETVTIETNKYGQIISVDSKQDKLKKLLLNRQLIPVLNDQKELMATSARVSLQGNQIKEWQVINLKKEKIRGQLYTAARLTAYINQKEYEAAIGLFSKKQQETLVKLKNDEQSLRFWISAWTMNETKWMQYASQIIKGQGIFVYEDNEWKIDEK
jgi:exopolyphosphatase/pppGpp-phosphohydrolase